jgi:hypothetical protein
MTENAWLVIVVIALAWISLALGYFVGSASATRETIEISQRAAILAGAAKWAANKDSGAPEFTWAGCNALGVSR